MKFIRFGLMLFLMSVAGMATAQTVNPDTQIRWSAIGATVLAPPASGTATATIQAALSGTTSDIYLSAGTYTTDRLSLNRSNVTIHGAGKGITIIQAVCPLTLTPQYGSSGGLLYVWPTSGSLSNVHIKDATFIGCDSTVNITSVTLDGTVATITANNSLTAGDNVGFNGLTGGVAPQLNGGGYFTVLSSGLSSTQFEVSFGGAAGGPYAQSAANFWLWNGAVVTYPTHQGIVIDGCTNCSVENVGVQSMGAESILFDPSIVGDNPIAQNDYVLGGAGNAISSNFAYGAQFLNNSIANNYGGNCIGWSGTATVAEGNVIRNCSGDGINSGGSGYVHDVLGYAAEISGNVIDGAHSCIHLSDDGATDTTTTWYDIANNICENYSLFGFESDLTQASDIIFIKGLNITGGLQNAEYGGTIAMAFQSGSGTYYISNSTLVGSGSPTAGQIYGIAVISGNPTIVPANNTIQNNYQGDVTILGGSPEFQQGLNQLTTGPTIVYPGDLYFAADALDNTPGWIFGPEVGNTSTIYLVSNSGGNIVLDSRNAGGNDVGSVTIYGDDEDYGIALIDHGGFTVNAPTPSFCGWENEYVNLCPDGVPTIVTVFGELNVTSGGEGVAEFWSDGGLELQGGFGGGFFQTYPDELGVSGSPYTLDYSARFEPVDATGGDVVINLDQICAEANYFCNDGLEYVFEKEDSTVNTVTIVPYSGQTIAGAANYVLSTQYQTVELLGNLSASNGGPAHWVIVP